MGDVQAGLSGVSAVFAWSKEQEQDEDEQTEKEGRRVVRFRARPDSKTGQDQGRTGQVESRSVRPGQIE